ncbi:MAG: hypothetical protein R6X18_10575 [Chloroflexota bacterium]|jgi:PhnB protein
MKHSYNPQGFPTVSLYLIVDGAAATISFLEDVLGANEVRRYPNPDRTINHYELT